MCLDLCRRCASMCKQPRVDRKTQNLLNIDHKFDLVYVKLFVFFLRNSKHANNGRLNRKTTS